LDHLAVELHDQAQDTVRRRVLRAEVNRVIAALLVAGVARLRHADADFDGAVHSPSPLCGRGRLVRSTSGERGALAEQAREPPDRSPLQAPLTPAFTGASCAILPRRGGRS